MGDQIGAVRSQVAIKATLASDLTPPENKRELRTGNSISSAKEVLEIVRKARKWWVRAER